MSRDHAVPSKYSASGCVAAPPEPYEPTAMHVPSLAHDTDASEANVAPGGFGLGWMAHPDEGAAPATVPERPIAVIATDRVRTNLDTKRRRSTAPSLRASPRSPWGASQRERFHCHTNEGRPRILRLG